MTEEFLCLGGHLSRYIQLSAVFPTWFSNHATLRVPKLGFCVYSCNWNFVSFNYLFIYSFFLLSAISHQFRPLSFVLNISFINSFIFLWTIFALDIFPFLLQYTYQFASFLVFSQYISLTLFHKCHLSLLTTGCHESSLSSNFRCV